MVAALGARVQQTEAEVVTFDGRIVAASNAIRA